MLVSIYVSCLMILEEDRPLFLQAAQRDRMP